MTGLMVTSGWRWALWGWLGRRRWISTSAYYRIGDRLVRLDGWRPLSIREIRRASSDNKGETR